MNKRIISKKALGCIIILVIVILLVLLSGTGESKSSSYEPDQIIKSAFNRYNDKEVKQLVLNTLQTKYELENPEIVKATEEYTEGGIAGKVYIYKFKVVTSDMTYVAEYISINEKLTADVYSDDGLKLYDTSDEEIKKE